MSVSSRRCCKPAGRWKVPSFRMWNRRERKRIEKAVDTENPQDNAPEALAEGGPFDSILEGQLTAMAAEREQFAAEKAELQERLLRARAEFENARRRWDRERLDYLQFAAMDMMRDLLPILDDFERALQVETADREYAKGVELIYQRMADTLTKLGLEPIVTAGQPFDPTCIRPWSGSRPRMPRTRPSWANSSEGIISEASSSGPRWSGSRSDRSRGESRV